MLWVRVRAEALLLTTGHGLIRVPMTVVHVIVHLLMPLLLGVQMNGLGMGAVYVEGGVGSINGCHFYDNHAVGGGGGALEILHVNLAIQNTRFEHNSATGVRQGDPGGWRVLGVCLTLIMLVTDIRPALACACLWLWPSRVPRPTCRVRGWPWGAPCLPAPGGCLPSPTAPFTTTPPR